MLKTSIVQPIWATAIAVGASELLQCIVLHARGDVRPQFNGLITGLVLPCAVPIGKHAMENLDALQVAIQMAEKFGSNAERIAADRIDRAMEAADAQTYDEWCSVADAIAVLTRGRPGSKCVKIEPVVRGSAAA